ncbi:lycopene cyclase family protein [Mucilaginibacter sp.]|uniref:lycopene cyclase family protein n=1 Tax=Mucilaginibacter sp. TaxID=1882438 RepID=UPI003B00B62B
MQLEFDIAIIGAGCAGWQLLQQLSLQDDWADCKVLLLDDGAEKQQSWCFWSAGNHPLQHLATKSWQQLSFRSAGFSTTQMAAPYVYHHIPGKVFFAYFEQQFLPQNPNITVVQAKVNRVQKSANSFLIDTTDQSFRAKTCYSSLVLQQNKQPELWQHFKGWYIETEQETFDDRAAVLMDYTVQLYQEVHFIYVLPFSKTRALVEATFFSAELVREEIYEELITVYLQQHFPQICYKITSAETGRIPMSKQTFGRYGTAGETLIGKAAGMVKASTGYTFNRITKDSAFLAKNRAQKQHLSSMATRGRFRFYDALLLNMIRQSPQIIPKVFARLFKNNRLPVVLRFLDEQTTRQQEVKIFASLPIVPFIKQAIKYIFTDRGRN